LQTDREGAPSERYYALWNIYSALTERPAKKLGNKNRKSLEETAT